MHGWLEDKASFLERYHQRSKAESVYSALKRCHGNYLSSHKRRAQRRELHLKTLAYNIGIANLTSVREENGLTFHSRLFRLNYRSFPLRMPLARSVPPERPGRARLPSGASRPLGPYDHNERAFLGKGSRQGRCGTPSGPT
jgi:hypothetical protein